MNACIKKYLFFGFSNFKLSMISYIINNKMAIFGDCVHSSCPIHMFRYSRQ